MKKSLLVVLGVILALSMVFFAACKEVVYEQPTITASDGSLTISYEGAPGFEYKIDGGDWQDGATVTLSQEVGEHVVTARVKAENATEATFTYTTTAIDLSGISLHGLQASWQYVGNAYLKVGDGNWTATTATSYTATQNETLGLKVVGGFDAANKIYYVGEDVEYSFNLAQIALATPTLVASETGLTWQNVSNASKYQVMVNNGEWTDATSYAWATDAGEYQVLVKAVGEGNYADSTPATYSYAVKNTSLRLQKTSGLAGTIVYEGVELLRKNGDEYEACAQTQYDEQQSVTYVFRVTGGWDENSKVYYLGASEQTYNFVKIADDVITVEDGEGKSTGTAQDEWDVAKLANTWTETTASLSVASSFDGGSCISLDCWNNGTKFRYSKAYDAADGYNVVAFDFRSDGIATIELSLKDSRTGIYANINLGKLPAYWQHYEIALSDANWKISYSGATVDVSTALQLAGEETGIAYLYEIIPFCDTVSIITSGNTPNGANAHLLIDNVKFFYQDGARTQIEQPLFALGDYYVPQNAANGEILWTMSIASDGKTAVLATADQTTSMTLDLAIDGDEVTLTENSDGNPLKLVGKFRDNGETVEIVSKSGAGSEYVAIGAKYTVAAHTLLDFEQTVGNGQYEDKAWTQERYIDSWTTISGQMNNRIKDGSKVVNFAASKGTAGKFTYNKNGASLGLANYFAIDLGNYYNEPQPINVKLSVIDAAGKTTYLLGDANNFHSFPATEGFVRQSVMLTTAIKVRSLVVTVQNVSNLDTQYLYMDNLTMAYVFDAPVEYAAPEFTFTDDGIALSSAQTNSFLWKTGNGDWQEGNLIPYATSDGNYTVVAKAKAEGYESATEASITYRVRSVSLSDVAVNDDAASWTAIGKVYVKANGGEWTENATGSYVATQTTELAVASRGYWNASEKTLYVGEVEKNATITFYTVATPELTQDGAGFTWTADEKATAYQVRVNDGEWQTATRYDLATTVGDYTVKVKGIGNGKNVLDGQETTFVYTVKAVALSEITLENATASWTAVGLTYISENGGAKTAYAQNTYVNSSGASLTLTVYAEGGWDGNTNTLYVGATLNKSVAIEYLQVATPVITADANGLTWTTDSHASAYQIKLDEGDWQNATAYAWDTAVGNGAHVLYVKGLGNGVNFSDSNVAQYSFTMANVSLSEITVDGDEASWTANGITYVKTGDGEWTASAASTYKATATTTVAVKAVGGWDGANNTFYYGDDVERSATITFYTVATPEYSRDGNGIAWTADEKATSYQIKVNDGEWQTATRYDLALVAGDYTVKIKGLGNGKNVLDSAEATFAYHVKNNSLSDIAVDGDTATWTANGITYVKTGDGEWTVTAATFYKATATTTISVKAETGWDDATMTLWIGDFEKNATITFSQLAATTIAATESGIVWTAVEGATGYEVTVNGTSKTQTATSLAFAETAGAYVVTVKALGNGANVQDGETATYSYTVADSSVEITANANGNVQWNAVGIKTQISPDGANYVDYPYAQYASAISGIVYVKAVGGWNGGTNVMYLGNDVKKVVLTVLDEQGNMLLDDAESYNATSDIVSWTKEKYGSTSWEVASDAIKIELAAKGDYEKKGNAIKLTSYANGNAYRFGKTFGTSDVVYAGLAFDIKLHAYSSSAAGSGAQTLVQLINSDGIYMSFTLNGKIEADKWYHVELTMNDSGWALNYNGQNITPSQAISYIGQSGFDSVVSKMNVVYVITKGSTGNGPVVATNIDNVKLLKTLSTTSFTQLVEPEPEKANLTLDFGTYSANADFAAAANNWSYDMYGNNGWTDVTSTQMRIRQGDAAESAVVNMAADGNTRRYFYNKNGAESLGLAKYFSVRIGNYYGSPTIQYKLAYVDVNGTVHYLAGDASTFADCLKVGSNDSPSTRTFTKLEYNFEAIEVQYFYFVIKSTSSTHLYVDDVKLLYEAPTNTDPEPGEPEDPEIPEIDITQYENVTEIEDFSSYSGSFPMSNSAGTVKSNLSYTATLYVRNDSGDGYNADGKYASAQYASSGTAVGTQKTLTYTLAEAGRATKFAMAIANNRNANAKAATITVKVFDVNDQEVLSQDFDVEAGAGWTLKEFTFTETAVKKAQIVITLGAYGSGDAFMKLDYFAFGGGTATAEEEEPTTVEVLKLDFEDGAGSGNYVNSAWTQYRWNGSAYEAASAKMNSRTGNGGKIVNLYCGYTTYKFVYNEGGTAIGSAHSFSMKVGNWYVADKSIKIRIAIEDTDGNMHYIAGTASTFETVACTGTSGTFVDFEREFDTIEVKSIVIFARYDATSADNYLYLDDITLSYVGSDSL